MVFVPTIFYLRNRTTSPTTTSSTANCNQTSLLLYGGNVRMKYNKNDTIEIYTIQYDNYRFSVSTYFGSKSFSEDFLLLDELIEKIINCAQESYNQTVNEFNLLPLEEEHGHISKFLLFLRLS